ACLLPGGPRPESLAQLIEQYVFSTERRVALFVFEDVQDPELIPYLVPGAGSSLVVTSRHWGPEHGLFEFKSVLDLGPLPINAALELLDGVAADVDTRQLAMRAGGNPLA